MQLALDLGPLLEEQARHRVVAQVVCKTQLVICLDRVGALFLQAVRANLVDEADATAFLTQVEQDAAAFLRNAAQRALELRAAVAALAEQRVSGQAFRMQPDQRPVFQWPRCRSKVNIARKKQY